MYGEERLIEFGEDRAPRIPHKLTANVGRLFARDRSIVSRCRGSRPPASVGAGGERGRKTRTATAFTDDTRAVTTDARHVSRHGRNTRVRVCRIRPLANVNYARAVGTRRNDETNYLHDP